MTWLSTIPGALTNLVSALRVPLGEQKVKDGPEVSSATLNEVVTVGFTDPETDSAVESAANPDGMAVQPQREQYSIHCKVEVVDGTNNLVAARTRAYELLGIVVDALAADQTLSGAVMSAHVGANVLTQAQASNGARATVAFDVDCDAFMKRT